MATICLVAAIILSPATVIGVAVIAGVVWAWPKVMKAWEEMDR